MMDAPTIRSAFTLLSEELAKIGVVGELNLVGGTAMVLAFRARIATKDVDAIFEPSAAIRDAAAQVSRTLDLPMDWLNDAAKGFLSPGADFVPIEDINLSNLRIQAPTPRYMLAMKVMASRAGQQSERGDRQDIEFLLRLLNIASAEEALGIVSAYYDPSRIPLRAQYLLDEIFEERSPS